jgi:hypothetical protein
MLSGNRPKRLVVFCDGTWCGRETGTFSNVQVLAEMVGDIQWDTRLGVSPVKVHPIKTSSIDVVAGYQEGIGLNKTFLEYIWDGSTASTIAEECIAVYRFIVENYTDDHEIWFFGLSRGAYTVRCVAGMINNCGIMRAREDPKETAILCEKIYQIYRSPLEVDKPKSPGCRHLRHDVKATWHVKTPIKFMGLFDTVGGLGIPRINAGVGFEWPEFYDDKISTSVEKVYHAVSLHDRLWIFQPCLAFRDEEVARDPRFEVHQKWFPGAHYDLGRQAFRFMRKSPSNYVEKLLGAIPDAFGKTIYPNEVLADLVLSWMLTAIQTHDGGHVLIPDIQERIWALNTRIAHPVATPANQPLGPTGSGEVYSDILEYGPAGGLWSPLASASSRVLDVFNRVAPNLGENIQDLLGIKTILRIVTATKDRRIPGGEGDVVPYKDTVMLDVGEGRTVYVNVGLAADVSEKRYRSQTFEAWDLWRRVFGGADL